MLGSSVTVRTNGIDLEETRTVSEESSKFI